MARDSIPARVARFKGFVWEGRSQLDGTPIVCVFTGFARPSKNAKTGAMVQTWILRQDVDPLAACRDGRDASVCGSCRHRPSTGGKCYVSVARAPLAVWRAYRAGAYEPLDLSSLEHMARFQGRMLRIGSYGDPVAVPFSVWATIRALGGLSGHVGYTHQWQLPIAQRFKGLVMASVDSPLEAEWASRDSWRHFRVAAAHEIPRTLERELVCPASVEMGRRLTCEGCKACSGNLFGQASVVIAAHGFRIGGHNAN